MTQTREDKMMLERLLEGVKAAGMRRHGRVTKLSKATGYSVGMVSDMLSGKEPLGEKFIKLACNELQISQQWLRTGNGVMKLRTPPAQQGIFSQPQSGGKVMELIQAELHGFSETEQLEALVLVRKAREARKQ